ncbi:hypothetical protein NM208_g14642 [Fusarium decemcellulare]|uniref:Uncharacterized protein n=1 Tax=Fusarium decemcellulare TaxID=57161 RepID=A0ACC1RFC8_9HYPO|nr:hypothetical protein NM208_g14642 [Fusarium decemcellulare]
MLRLRTTLRGTSTSSTTRLVRSRRRLFEKKKSNGDDESKKSSAGQDGGQNVGLKGVETTGLVGNVRHDVDFRGDPLSLSLRLGKIPPNRRGNTGSRLLSTSLFSARLTMGQYLAAAAGNDEDEEENRHAEGDIKGPRLTIGLLEGVGVV